MAAGSGFGRGPGFAILSVGAGQGLGATSAAAVCATGRGVGSGFGSGPGSGTGSGSGEGSGCGAVGGGSGNGSGLGSSSIWTNVGSGAGRGAAGASSRAVIGAVVACADTGEGTPGVETGDAMGGGAVTGASPAFMDLKRTTTPARRPSSCTACSSSGDNPCAVFPCLPLWDATAFWEGAGASAIGKSNAIWENSFFITKSWVKNRSGPLIDGLADTLIDCEDTQD